MERKLIYKILLVLGVVGLCAYYTFPLDKRINLGLDLQGGMHLLLKVDTSHLQGEAKIDACDRAVEVIRNRIDEFGVRETSIQKQGEDEIVVQLPGVTDRERAIELIGKTAMLEEALPNVIAHGEKPFAQTIPYIQHADIGIAPYRPAPNADYLSQSSMKMMQYTYCRLPIVAPLFAAAGREHVLSYNPADEGSIVRAMEQAISFDRNTIGISAVADWSNIVDRLCDGVGESAAIRV